MQEEWKRNKYGGLFKVTNDYMNDKIRSKSTSKDKINTLNKEYKDILRYPIESFKNRTNWGAGMGSSGKGGKYITTYHAKLKTNEDIYETDINILNEKLKKRSG